MYATLDEFFNKNIPDVKYDGSLAKELEEFRTEWILKNPEHSDFLSSGLFGVYSFTFSALDEKKLLSIYGVYGITEIQNEFYKVSGVNKDFKISSNIIYNTLLYTAHRFLINGRIKEDNRIHNAKIPILLIQYRMFSSLYSYFFKSYKLPESKGMLVYENLSNKFLIKQLKSWNNVFDYRANQMLDKKESTYKSLVALDVNKAALILNDTQTKIRSSIKILFLEVLKAKDSEIKSTELIKTNRETEETFLADIVTTAKFTNKIKTIAYDKYEIINYKLIDHVSSMFKTLSIPTIVRFLECLTDENLNDHKDYFYILDKMFSATIEYLIRIGINPDDKSRLFESLVMVKNYWSNSKVKNTNISEVKEYLSDLASRCTKKKTQWVIVSLTIFTVVYLYLLSHREYV